MLVPEQQQTLIPQEHIRKERHLVHPCFREVVSNILDKRCRPMFIMPTRSALISAIVGGDQSVILALLIRGISAFFFCFHSG
jgi:hypothetical protein